MSLFPPEIVAARAELDPLFDKLYRIDRDWGASSEAQRELEAKGSEIVDVLLHEFWLVACLHTQNLVTILSQTGDSRAYPMLMHALRHFSIPVRAAAAQGLAKIGDARAVPEIVNAWHSDLLLENQKEAETTYENTFLESICQIGTPALVALLTLVVKRRDDHLYSGQIRNWHLIAEAILALMSIRQEDIFTHLFNQPQIEVMGHDQPLNLRFMGLDFDDGKHPEEFGSVLIKLIYSEDPSLRQAGAISIGLAGFTPAIPLLIETLKNDQHEGVILHAISALGRLKVAEAVGLIANRLRKVELLPLWYGGNIYDTYTTPGWIMIRALESIGSPHAFQVLDSEPYIHRLKLRRPIPPLDGDTSSSGVVI